CLPLFVMSPLPYAKFQSVYQMVMDEDFPACTRLLSCTHSLASLHNVAEEKEVGSPKFHHYCQERTMEWLKKKAERTVKALGKTNISVGEGVKSMTYVRVKKESETQEEDYLQYAHGLISADISEDLRKALLKHLHRSNSIHPILIRQNSDFACKKTLAKVDKTGMKSLSAFFSPKGKAEKLNVRMVHQNLYVYVGVRGYTECTKH
uniref:Ribonuclease H2 subunit B wHTH domain-containing protein n=1 Tax=Salmo trutta TaxID=8032 RepID=A0A673W8F0_SALTR